MFGNDHYSGVSIGQEIIPINTPKGIKVTAVNIILIDDSGSNTIIVLQYHVNDNVYVQDLYYNGYEECFKYLTSDGHEVNSWEDEDMGVTPDCILNGEVNNELFYKYIMNK